MTNTPVLSGEWVCDSEFQEKGSQWTREGCQTQDSHIYLQRERSQSDPLCLKLGPAESQGLDSSPLALEQASEAHKLGAWSSETSSVVKGLIIFSLRSRLKALDHAQNVSWRCFCLSVACPNAWAQAGYLQAQLNIIFSPRHCCNCRALVRAWFEPGFIAIKPCASGMGYLDHLPCHLGQM